MTTVGRPVHVLTALLSAVVLAACSGGGASEVEPGGAAARFDDGRVTFDHPADWEIVEQGGPDEYRTRIEPPGARDEREDLPDGAIVVLWPFVANWDLDAAVGAWGPNADDPLVTDVSEEDVDVPGAEAAVAHHYRVRDATGGGGLEEDPATYRSVIAMGEVGRTVVVLIGAPDGGDIDVDEVADLVFGSLELEQTWE
jgi:hypothetical protein